MEGVQLSVQARKSLHQTSNRGLVSLADSVFFLLLFFFTLSFLFPLPPSLSASFLVSFSTCLCLVLSVLFSFSLRLLSVITVFFSLFHTSLSFSLQWDTVATDTKVTSRKNPELTKTRVLSFKNWSLPEYNFACFNEQLREKLLVIDIPSCVFADPH